MIKRQRGEGESGIKHLRSIAFTKRFLPHRCYFSDLTMIGTAEKIGRQRLAEKVIHDLHGIAESAENRPGRLLPRLSVQMVACLQASLNTHSPMGRKIPFSSALKEAKYYGEDFMQENWWRKK